MGKVTDKVGIAHLVEICYQRGLKRVVLSPGSRNAPLSISFLGHGGFDVRVVGDERSAGFIALGMSQSDGVATILVCTSGTALLNYGPAVAESFYQRIPLLILSADRPEEWVNQMEGQTMQQEAVLSNFLNKEFQLPQEPKEQDRIWFNDRLVNEAITGTSDPKRGPVHINVPLKEPLYNTVEYDYSKEVKIIESAGVNSYLKDSEWTALLEELVEAKKVMLIMGLGNPGSISDRCIDDLLAKGVVILNECTSNLAREGVNSWVDRSIEALSGRDIGEYLPDLVISVGGPLVSKRLKLLMRNNGIQSHWHVDGCNPEIDLFQCLTRAIKADPRPFIKDLSDKMVTKGDDFKSLWSRLNDEVVKAHESYLDSAPYSDLIAYRSVLKKLPANAHIQMANSAAVRYVQLFKNRRTLCYYSNRGVSGIDGCTSTAVGMALVKDEPVILLSGDMAFRYDSNAFWNKDLPRNLKCIIVNNGGGGIFRIIPGPESTDYLEEAFESHQENSAEGIANLYDIPYIKASDTRSIEQGLDLLFSKEGLMILEIFTPREANATVLRDYFKHISNNTSG